MEQELVFKCSCGQVTYLVADGDKYRFDAKKHGSDAINTGACFSCNAQFAELVKEEPPAEKPAPVERDASVSTKRTKGKK